MADGAVRSACPVMPDDLAALRPDLVEPDAANEPLTWRAVIGHPTFRVVAVVAGLALVAAFMLLRAGSAKPVTAPPAFSAAPIVALPTATATPSIVIVDVAGKVRRPGLVRLPTGSRVADAIAAAGGVKPGTAMDSLNLARVLADGEQVNVGVPAEPGAGVGGGGAAGPLMLNTASAQDLDALPGIGPVLAGRIVAWRTAHGPFASVDALTDVPGIGPAMLARLADLVRV
jgi:competence protein ComEA